MQSSLPTAVEKEKKTLILILPLYRGGVKLNCGRKKERGKMMSRPPITVGGGGGERRISLPAFPVFREGEEKRGP